MIRPEEERRQLLENATAWFAERKDAPVRWIASLVGSWTWFFLLNRAALSVFHEVYAISSGKSMDDVVELTEAFRSELWAAIHISVLLWVAIDAEFGDSHLMSDASSTGGALVRSPCTPEESAEESIWAGRGGFFTVKETDILAMHEIEEWTALAGEDREEVKMIPNPEGWKVPEKLEGTRCVELRFLVLFSGANRYQDLEWWLKETAEAIGALVRVEVLDLESEEQVDLLDPIARGAVLERVRAGYYDGVHLEPPCGTLSRVLWSAVKGEAPRGQGPYRSRAEPWGLKHLSSAKRK